MPRDAPTHGSFIDKVLRRSARRRSLGRTDASVEPYSSRSLRSLAAIPIAAALLGLCGVLCTGQGLARLSGIQLKAVLIKYCLEFTNWPSEVFRDANSPLVIGMLGKDPLASTLSGITSKIIQKRHVLLKEVQNAQEAKECHLLFVTAAEVKNLPQLLAELKNTRILTVSDAEGFTRRGGVVRLTPEKVAESPPQYFEISKSARQKAGLEFGNDLMNFAAAVP